MKFPFKTKKKKKKVNKNLESENLKFFISSLYENMKKDEKIRKKIGKKKKKYIYEK